MGLYGGWWGVGVFLLLTVFFIREVLKWMRGQVDLTARQKVLRILAGVCLLGVFGMILFAPVVLGTRPGASRVASAAQALMYLSVAGVLSMTALLMAVMDFAEVGRQYTQAHRDLRRHAVTREDIDRLLREQRRDSPEDVGRGPGTDAS